MSLTKEQQVVVDTATSLYKMDTDETLLVAACAGAGKTHTLIELAKAVAPKHAMYLAYNKAIQLEAESKFKGTPVVCKTMHALAYGHTVRKYGLNLQKFTYRDVDEDIPYKDKMRVVSILDSFLLSGSTEIDEFLVAKDVVPTTAHRVLKYYAKMMHGEVGGGHTFYLKLYHILLENKTIQPPKLDLLMVDELGDITALTVEIFRLIKARLKVGVGDAGQNIYGFNSTINGFKVLEAESTTLRLTQSFRVASNIAEDIQAFCTATFDPDMIFTGRKMTGKEKDTSHCYIARNNSGMLEKMFTLVASNVPFNLTRNPVDIFGLILALATLKPGGTIFDAQYKWLGAVANKHEKLVSNGQTKTKLLQYIAQEYSHDISIKSALSVIMKHGTPALFDLFNTAKKYKADSKTYYTTLTTAHSSKGLEFTSVTILEDLNNAARNAVNTIKYLDPVDNVLDINKLNEELRLYYVACSRSMLHLHNADVLKLKH